MQYDVVVIGGGPGGYVAAIRAAQLKLKTAIIEKEKLGGICLNWGCIPTKALLKSAEVLNLIKNSKEYGINVSNVEFDFNKIIKRSRDVSTRIVKGVEFLIKKNKIDRFDGTAKLIDSNTISIFDSKGDEINKITSNNLIIATGARSRQIPGIKNDGKVVISSTEAMILPKLPKDMIIIGAGAIGVEFSYFYNSLGTKVTLIEMLPNILPIEDEEVSIALEKEYKKYGIKVMTNTKVKDIKVSGGSGKVLVEKDGKEQEIDAEVVLVAIGVQGNIENLGLEEIGIKTERSFIKVDKLNYKTNIDNIYAIGDVSGPPWLAHVASAEGIVCVETIAGHKSKPVDYDSIPGCTYCNPQVASIGISEKKAKELGIDYKIGKYEFRSHGKSLAVGENVGFVKLILDKKYGELLGAHIIGAEATELIAELCLGKSIEATGEFIHRTMHAHPTLSEAIMEAAADAYNECIHK